LVGVVSLLLVGCGGDGPALVRVTGTVTRAGKPVPDLVVNFVPEKGYRSVGKTDAEGKFTLLCVSGKEGVAVGQHKVWVQVAPTGLKDDPEAKQSTGKRSPELAAILRKYGSADTSPLKLEITTARDIDLPLD
jgi:hypothetical protein